MHNHHHGLGCNRVKLCQVGQPKLSANQGSYLDQMQANDQKRSESEARLKQMGFSKVTGSYSGFKIPPGGSLWSKGVGALGLGGGIADSVSLAPDGTVAPAL
jgi:hypothetical protein